MNKRLRKLTIPLLRKKNGTPIVYRYPQITLNLIHLKTARMKEAKMEEATTMKSLKNLKIDLSKPIILFSKL